MAAEVGWASLGIVPTLDRGAMRRIGASVDGSARSTGRRFGSLFAASAGIGLGALAGKLVKDAVTLEATYSTTMRQIGVATDAPQKKLQQLDDLAMQLGADTIFSASDASEAMLELAKNGITPAIIQAGALESALTLAAAGGVPLEQAAVVMGNALNAFGLRGKDAESVAAALAGAANASSASVGDLASGLQQASAVAADAGLTVQETTAGLAAFANAGISGSDAGTSLKTMLSRLVPQTKKARKEMERLGLNFTDAQGEFIPFVDIAEQLQEKLSDLSAEERTTALTTIFGSDARRAATVLMNEGGEGIKKYTKATSDQTQADKLAKTAMEGTAGALERLKGDAETAQLQLGKGLAPLVEDLADGIGNMIDSGDFEKWGAGIADGLKGIAEDYSPLAGELKELGEDLLPAIGTAMGVTRDALEIAAPLAAGLVGAFNDMPEDVKKFLLFMAGGAVVGKKVGVGKLLFGGKGGLGGGLISKAKPIPVFVTNPGFGGGVGAGGKPKGKLASGLKTGAKAVPFVGLAAVGFELGGDEFGAGGATAAGVGAGDAIRHWRERGDKSGEAFSDGFRDVFAAKADIFEQANIPTELKTDIAINGVPESKAQVRELIKQYDLTPAEKRTLFDIAGFDRTLDRIKRINSELDWAARPREARIKITKAYAGAGYQTAGGLQEGNTNDSSMRRSQRRAAGGF